MTTPRLVIGNKNYSSWSLRPWLLLRHFGVDFDEHPVSLFRDDMVKNLTPVSPTLKVPVLHHGDLVIWDSLAICEYVNEALLGGSGWPKDLAARSVARAACAEMHAGFSTLRSRWPMNCRLQRKLPVDDALAVDLTRIENLWQDCLARFGGDEGYLFNTFSIADCFFAPVVLRFHSYRPALGPVAEKYVLRMLDNEALKDWFAAGIAETEIIEEDEIDVLIARHPEHY